MKRLFVTGVILIATVAFAIAQQPQSRAPEDRAKAMTDRLVELLKLTDAQKTKVYAIELELSKERDTQMQRNQGNRDNMRTAMEAINKKRDEKFKEVLTAEQFKKYEEDNEQRVRNMQDRQRR